MSSALCLTLRFLDPVPQFHGRGDDGDPEWPPSPLRLFQTLVAASANRWRDALFNDFARPALQWIEARLPTIVAPGIPPKSFGYRMYVPNNSGDLMTSAWARGDTETTMAKFRVEKDVRPTHLRGGEAIHYLWKLSEAEVAEYRKHEGTLAAAARSITHLGWGVDMVAGDASLITEDEASKLPGERWLPAEGSAGTNLRVPQAGTLDDLVRKHGEFLGRLSESGFKPVAPLRAFRVVAYRRATEPSPRKWVAFAILKPDASGNASFDTARRCRDVAAWLRCATSKVCDEWPFGDIAGFVHGHAADGTQARGTHADDRFMYLPLPTINPVLGRVESIRRVLIAAPVSFADRIDWIRRRLPGQDLVDQQGEVRGLLNLLPTKDWVLEQYTKASQTWSTVTPVVMPGHDDGDEAEAERLLRRAFSHAGLADELVRSAELEWRAVGFRAGLQLAKSYRIPESPNRLPTVHVRVRFTHAIQGPLAIGAGRYRGIGVFAGGEYTG